VRNYRSRDGCETLHLPNDVHDKILIIQIMAKRFCCCQDPGNGNSFPSHTFMNIRVSSFLLVRPSTCCIWPMVSHGRIPFPLVGVPQGDGRGQGRRG
jgi:hypothetical protein